MKRAVRLSIGILPLLIACDRPGEADPTASIIDVDALPALALTEEVRIGSVSDAAIGFGRIGGVRVAPDGRVFVLESQERQIRIYSPDGERLGSIGRGGGGPGEFELPSAFGIAGDTLWVQDARLRRITLFTTGGEVLATVPTQGITIPVAEVGVSLSVVPFALHPDGTFSSTIQVAIRGAGAPGRGAPDSVRVPLVRFDMAGEVIDTVGSRYVPITGAANVVRVGGTVLIAPNDLDHSEVTTDVGAGRIMLSRPPATDATGGEFGVRHTDETGATHYERRFRYAPRPVTQSFRDSVVDARFAQLPPQMRRRELELAVHDALPDVPFHPPVVSVLAGEDGSALVRRTDLADGEARWIRLAPDGTVPGELRLDRRAAVLWIGGERLWVVELDGFDVPWLVRYRIGHPG